MSHDPSDVVDLAAARIARAQPVRTINFTLHQFAPGDREPAVEIVTDGGPSIAESDWFEIAACLMRGLLRTGHHLAAEDPAFIHAPLAAFLIYPDGRLNVQVHTPSFDGCEARTAWLMGQIDHLKAEAASLIAPPAQVANDG